MSYKAVCVGCSQERWLMQRQLCYACLRQASHADQCDCGGPRANPSRHCCFCEIDKAMRLLGTSYKPTPCRGCTKELALAVEREAVWRASRKSAA